MSLEDRFPVHTGDAPAAGAALVPHPSTNGSEEEPERRDLDHPKAVIRALLDGSVITVSPTGIVNEWNDRARLAFGIEDEDAVGRALLDVIVPPDRRAPTSSGSPSSWAGTTARCAPTGCASARSTVPGATSRPRSC